MLLWYILVLSTENPNMNNCTQVLSMSESQISNNIELHNKNEKDDENKFIKNFIINTKSVFILPFHSIHYKCLA